MDLHVIGGFLGSGKTTAIIKGQANYETLSEAGPHVFCLLQVKCPIIARDLSATVDSVVVRQCLTTHLG